MLAGTAAAGLAAFGAPTLAGIGAGLGSFLETGDVGKGIQTGLIAGLGGKAMGALTGGGNAALSGAIGDTTSGATKAAIDAAMKEGGQNAFLKGVTSKGLQGSLAGATLPGVGTAALVGSALNPPTMKMPEKKTYDIPPPMPRIRSYQPKKNPDSTAEETMISYGPPVAQPKAEEDFPFTNYVNNYRPPVGMYGNMFAEGGEVKKMRGGGMLGTSGILSIGHASQLFPRNQYGHPAFNPLANALTQGINSTTGEKVKPFIQEVETMAKNRFGPNVFQQQQFFSDALQPTGPAQLPSLPIYETNFGPQPIDPFARPMRPDSNNGIDMLPNLNRIPEDPFSLVDLQGVMPATLQGFAEGGIVSEEMNEKELIEEAVAAIKGESDNPKEILGMFLLKFGEEQLRNLVESVQSGELDETRERFADGNKGMVNGPGDGSGKDDMVPATMDGDQDVLLTAGEFVIKKDSTDAIEKAFGGGFLDEVNDAGKDAPKKLKEKVAVA
jgi:hypothetical protein